MDNLERFRSTFRQFVFLLLLLENFVILSIALLALQHHIQLSVLTIVGGFGFAIVGAVVIALLFAWAALQPLQALWQAILHLSPNEQGIAAPKVEDLKFGQELVATLTGQIYQLASVADKASTEIQSKTKDLSQNFIAQNLPLPLFVLDSGENIKYANAAAAQYIGIKSEDMIGKNVYMVLDMSFPSESTFDQWLKGVKANTATASASWERVRLNVHDDHPEHLFDLAAYYNRDNPQHSETMLILFDHTKAYSQDDQAVSFIALSVHELRTPLTLLRGYIEVFEDEIDTSGNPELESFMQKMSSQADQLMAFVSNILNVARIDNDQLEFHLEEAVWPDVLKQAIQALSLRAKVRDITLHCRFSQDLPTVGIDQLSIMEVINNLIDNAIKYSGDSKTIEVETHLNQEGLIETTIKDYGLGIGASIIPNLFTKFYRDHRNRAQIGGTGLGLYLSKAIVTAHGGNVWVRSQEGQGSTFGFTLVPYAKLAQDAKKTGHDDLVRGAHGWIKNHSLYRS